MEMNECTLAVDYESIAMADSWVIEGKNSVRPKIDESEGGKMTRSRAPYIVRDECMEFQDPLMGFRGHVCRFEQEAKQTLEMGGGKFVSRNRNGLIWERVDPEDALEDSGDRNKCSWKTRNREVDLPLSKTRLSTHLCGQHCEEGSRTKSRGGGREEDGPSGGGGGRAEDRKGEGRAFCQHDRNICSWWCKARNLEAETTRLSIHMYDHYGEEGSGMRIQRGREEDG